MIESAVLWLLKVLAAPAVGLSSVFIIAFISATLVPLGSEPAVFAVVKANPAMFWPAILVAGLSFAIPIEVPRALHAPLRRVVGLPHHAAGLGVEAVADVVGERRDGTAGWRDVVGLSFGHGVRVLARRVRQRVARGARGRPARVAATSRSR